MDSPHTCIVLVNWNGLHDTRECVRSCLALEGVRFHIVVIDNGSTDGSCHALRAEWEHEPRVTLLATGRNLGFAGASNRGIAWSRAAGAELVWLLNNDTVVAPDSLRALVEAAAAHPQAGILGSKIHYHDRPDTLWFAGGSIDATGNHYSRHRGFNEIDRGQYDRVEQVEYITGCSLLVRGATLDDIYPMTEDYFMYWEDVDWCTRARHAGWQCLYVPRSTLRHKVGSATHGQPGIRVRYETRNRLRYLWRYRRPLAVEALATLSLDFVRSFLRGDLDFYRQPLAGVRDFFAGRTGRVSP